MSCDYSNNLKQRFCSDTTKTSPQLYIQEAPMFENSLLQQRWPLEGVEGPWFWTGWTPGRSGCLVKPCRGMCSCRASHPSNAGIEVLPAALNQTELIQQRVGSYHYHPGIEHGQVHFVDVRVPRVIFGHFCERQPGLSGALHRRRLLSLTGNKTRIFEQTRINVWLTDWFSE